MEVLYAAAPMPDYVLGAVDTVVDIHQSEGPGDILVFMTGTCCVCVC